MIQKQKLEHKILIKKITIRAGIALVIFLILYLWIFGIFANINNFWKNLGRNRLTTATDLISPLPPYLNNIPEVTNKESVEILGNTEEGVKVILFLNSDKVSETIADRDGSFNFGQVTISKGSNVFYAIAKDDAGNESVESENLSISYDNKKPTIEINSPINGKSYSDKVRSILVQGKTKSGSTVLINDQIAQIKGDGEFSLPFYPNEGSNKLKLEVTDKAGNTSKEEIFFSFNEE